MTAANLHRALEIILRADPDADVYAEHDQIWCGDATAPMSDTDRAVLDGLGWYEDNDAWSHFT